VKGITMTDSTEIDDLKRELAQVKAAMKPHDPAAMEREVREWRDKVHKMREAHMAHASNFSNEDLRAMEAACSTRDIQDIVKHGTIPSPSGAGVSGQITKISSNPGIPGSNTGWRDAIPLGPQPHIQHVDRLMAAEDMEFRRQRMLEEAQRQAMLRERE
jgi:hypothetical protein